jgi:endo-1,4-beta-xylanase
MKPKRLVLIAAVVSVSTLGWVVAPSTGQTSDRHPGRGRPQVIDQSLRKLARPNHLRIGTAVDMDALADDATYRDRIAVEFSSVTAENVMKWETIEPERGELDFGLADELMAFARENRQRVRGHTLLWHNQLPSWLTEGVASGEITPDELREILRQHITDVVSHFRGRIDLWDVVNEVIDDDAELRDTIWLQQLGPGYIADAFRWAHRADPRAKLYLNDYNVEGINDKSDAYYALAQQLLDEGVPLHGMGVQGRCGPFTRRCSGTGSGACRPPTTSPSSSPTTTGAT